VGLALRVTDASLYPANKPSRLSAPSRLNKTGSRTLARRDRYRAAFKRCGPCEPLQCRGAGGYAGPPNARQRWGPGAASSSGTGAVDIEGSSSKPIVPPRPMRAGPTARVCSQTAGSAIPRPNG
jgi:hypothetical protein